MREGGLVAIPTETVYGLAANALDENAVRNIFLAKGRPQDNPLIIHISSIDWLPKYAYDIPKAAYDLAEAYWPGPMTMILKRRPIVPAIVSAGLDTVAIRFPSHPVASAVIAEAGVPLAAPSANLSGKPSPTKAEHVLWDLDGKIDAVLDGGECAVGLESTVVTLCGDRPRLLRPGGITPEQLRSVLGDIEIDRAVLEKLSEGTRVASPGMKYKHYAPKAHVTIVKGDINAFSAYIRQKEKDSVILCFDDEEKLWDKQSVTYGEENDSLSQAQRLFDALRHLDEIGAKTVYARCPKIDGVGLAVYNRLLRAAGFDVVEL